MGDELESCDVSSLFVNGTSFEEIREMAANMKLPFVPEKTVAQVQTNEKVGHQRRNINIADFNVNKFMTQQSDSASKIATESNYITNEGIQGGITQNNKCILNTHLISNQSFSHKAI